MHNDDKDDDCIMYLCIALSLSILSLTVMALA